MINPAEEGVIRVMSEPRFKPNTIFESFNIKASVKVNDKAWGKFVEDTREGLKGECLSKSVLSDDDSTKQELLPEHASLAFFSSEDMYGFYDFVDSDSDDFDDGAAMLPNLKDERIIVSTTDQRDRHDAALLPMDTYIHKASPQPVGLPDGEEIVQLQSIGEKSLVDFDATNNRGQSGVLVSNSKKKYTLEVSRERCMTQSLLSLVESTRRISTDFDSPDNREHLNSPVVFNSEKEDAREASKGEYSTKNALSLDDSTKQNSFPDFDATISKAHLVEAYHSDPVVSLSENKNSGGALNRECIVKSVLCLEDLRQHCGGRCDDVEKSFGAISDLGFRTTDSLAWTSFEVLETLAPWEQPDDCVPLLSLGRSTLGSCVQQEKSPDLPRVMQIDAVGQRVTKSPRYLEGFTAQKWATRKRYSAGDKRSFQVSRVSMNEKLGSRLQFIHMSHCAKADESGPTVSNSEKGSLREALKCDSLTNTRSLNDLREHFGARRKDTAKGLCDSLALKSFEVLDSLPLGEQSNSIRNLTQRRTLTHKHCVRLKKSQDLQQSLLSDCSGELAAQAPLGLSDGGHIPSLPEKKIVRKTLKRKSRTMSVLSLEDDQQHVGRRWEDVAKFLGAKRICRQLAIDRKPPEKRILRQHGTRRCQFKQSAIDLPDGGHILSLSKKKIVRKTLKRKSRNMSVLRSEYHQHVDNKWDDAVKSLGGAHAAKHIYRELVIHRVSRAKHIRRQHGFHRWPFQLNWATLKGYFLGDERPVAVISLSIDGKLVSRLQLIHVSWLGRFSPRPPALPPGGEIVGPPLALSSSQLPSTSNKAQLGGQDWSGSTASHSQNERTRDQPEDHKRKIKHITIEDLRPLVRYNRADAAKKLGVSLTTFKRRRKELGILRWPILPPKEVFIPPDGNGENNPPPTSTMLSTNGQITMEIEMGGPNSEPNECLPNSFEDPNFPNIGNGSIAEFESPTIFLDSPHGQSSDVNFHFSAPYNETEAAVGLGYFGGQVSELSNSTFPVYSDAAAPSQHIPTILQPMPHPQIASAQILSENMESFEDRGKFFRSTERASS